MACSTCNDGSCADCRTQNGWTFCRTSCTGMASPHCADVCARSGGACAWMLCGKSHSWKVLHLKDSRYRIMNNFEFFLSTNRVICLLTIFNWKKNKQNKNIELPLLAYDSTLCSINILTAGLISLILLVYAIIAVTKLIFKNKKWKKIIPIEQTHKK